MPVQHAIPVVFFRLDSGFTVHAQKLVLLHGFIKKSRRTPANELATAKRRLNKLRQE
jgi:phage-related protein